MGPKKSNKAASVHASLGTKRVGGPSVLSRGRASDHNIRYTSLPTSDSSIEQSGTTESDSESVTSQSPVRQYSGKEKRKEKNVLTQSQNVPIESKQTEQELEFLTLVNTGNVSEAIQFLSTVTQNKEEFDINRKNFDGFSFLHIAVHRQDEEMLKVLLPVEDILLYDTFFYAIKEGDIGMVKQFIDFEVNRQDEKTGSFRKLSQKSKQDEQRLKHALDRLESSKNNTFNSEFDEDVTPLMLAAQCGHYELIKLFFDSGQKMAKIDDIDCTTEKCKLQGELKISYARLHLYQAVSNPAYICFMSLQFNSVDPILEAFNLITDMKEVSSMEPEVKNEYAQLITKLQEFIGDLLGLCRDDTEVDLLLKQKMGFEGNSREAYPRLILALQIHQTEFVTHPHTQKALYSEWIRGFESWENMGVLRRGFEFVWRTLLLVLISLWQCFYCRCWTCRDCNRMMTSPVSRFIHSLGSHFILLTLLILESNLDKFGDEFDIYDKSPPRSSVARISVELGILIFEIGAAVSTLKQFCFMPRMFFQLWNIYEVTNHIFYFLAYIFWFIAWMLAPDYEFIIHADEVGGRKYWDAYHPLLLGEAFFSLAVIMSFGKILRVLQLHSKFGPLQIALGKMLKDMGRLIVPFLTVIIAFAAGMCMLYKAYATWVDKYNGAIKAQKQGYTTMHSASETLFWGLYGMAGLDSFEVLSIHHSKEEHGNDTVENHHKMIQVSGKTIYAVYHIFATIVLLNTIVAMMTGSAGKVFKNVDKEYKFGRSEVWIFYGRDVKVPPPFNTIALLRNITLLRCFGLAGDGKKWKRGMNLNRCCFVDEVNPDSDKKLRNAYSILVKALIQRYFHAKATISLSQFAKLDHLTKVRETVGELRERFKAIFTDVTGTTPTRKLLKLGTTASAVSKFKKLAGTRTASAQELLENFKPLLSKAKT